LTDKFAAPTVEFTSLSLGEESSWALGPSIQPLPNFESRQHNVTTHDDTFAEMPGNPILAPGSGLSLPLSHPVWKSIAQTSFTGRKRSRELESDDERGDVKRRRVISSLDPFPQITGRAKMTKAFTTHRNTSPPLIIGLPRRSVLSGEKRSRNVLKRSFEEVEQSADEIIADGLRYAKRRRTLAWGGPP
jgi:hypothetical protein